MPLLAPEMNATFCCGAFDMAFSVLLVLKRAGRLRPRQSAVYYEEAADVKMGPTAERRQTVQRDRSVSRCIPRASSDARAPRQIGANPQAASRDLDVTD